MGKKLRSSKWKEFYGLNPSILNLNYFFTWSFSLEMSKSMSFHDYIFPFLNVVWFCSVFLLETFSICLIFRTRTIQFSCSLFKCWLRDRRSWWGSGCEWRTFKKMFYWSTGFEIIYQFFRLLQYPIIISVFYGVFPVAYLYLWVCGTGFEHRLSTCFDFSFIIINS